MRTKENVAPVSSCLKAETPPSDFGTYDLWYSIDLAILVYRYRYRYKGEQVHRSHRKRLTEGVRQSQCVW